MSSTSTNTSTTTTDAGTRLTLEIWHPNCWGLQATEVTDAGLLVHTVHRTVEGTVKGHFTAYGDTLDDVDALVGAARDSSLTFSVVELDRRPSEAGRNLGNTARELFVEYDPRHSISDALVSRGFIHDAPVRVRDGVEQWPVFVTDDRTGIRERLDALREQTDAEIRVSKIASTDGAPGTASTNHDALTPRQREIFDLACEHNYYAWPREITTRDLADEVGLSKTTMLEHLRKAEAKLLNPSSN